MFFDRKTLFIGDKVFFDNKQCFSIEKHSFSLEKHSLSRKTMYIEQKNIVFLYIIHLALINFVYRRKTMFSSDKQSLSVNKQCLSN